MGYEVAALEEEVYVVRTPALHAIRRAHPRGILRRRPIQLGHDLPAQFGDGGLDRFVELAPVSCGIFVFIVGGVGVGIVGGGENAAVAIPFALRFVFVVGKDDAVGAEVVDEGLGEGDDAGFGGYSLVSSI